MPYDNAYANLTSGQFQEWELGFQYNMPLGFRKAYAGVRNAQFHIARERAVLQEQERQAIHDLSGAIADVDRSYDVAQVAFNRLTASQDQYRRAYDAFFELGGKVSLELVLDARLRLADAETSYHRARIDYAVALKNVHYEKGSLLEYNGAMLAHNQAWCGAPADIARKKLANGEFPVINYILGEREQQSTHANAESTPQLSSQIAEKPAEPAPFTSPVAAIHNAVTSAGAAALGSAPQSATTPMLAPEAPPLSRQLPASPPIQSLAPAGPVTAASASESAR
jgi:hypothetical protein